MALENKIENIRRRTALSDSCSKHLFEIPAIKCFLVMKFEILNYCYDLF